MFKGKGRGSERGGQFHRAFQSATRDGQGAGAPTLKGFRGFLADLACSEQQNPCSRKITEDLLGEVDGDVGHADLTLVDCGLGANVFSVLKRLLKHAVKHGSYASASLRFRVSVLHLSKDLGFAKHLRIQTTRNLEQMHQGVAPCCVFTNSRKLRERKA